nr:hypothetical protein [Candidatus Aquarickettsia rohweri]
MLIIKLLASIITHSQELFPSLLVYILYFCFKKSQILSVKLKTCFEEFPVANIAVLKMLLESLATLISSAFSSLNFLL